MPLDPLLIARILVCAFFAAVLLQSGVDKVVDWKGNLDWLTGHFSKTFFRSQVKPMLTTVMILEIAAGILCLISIPLLIMGIASPVPTLALGLTGLNFVMLITGQRIAKDYAGAAVLAAYFAVNLIGLYLMQSPR